MIQEYTFNSIAELREAVERSGDILAVEMWQVRDAYGADRLGRVIRDNIANALKGHGLGTLPATLPTYQTEEVRVYKLGSKVASVIDAVVSPSEGGDEQLRDASQGSAADALAAIREIACG